MPPTFGIVAHHLRSALAGQHRVARRGVSNGGGAAACGIDSLLPARGVCLLCSATATRSEGGVREQLSYLLLSCDDPRLQFPSSQKTKVLRPFPPTSAPVVVVVVVGFFLKHCSVIFPPFSIKCTAERDGEGVTLHTRKKMGPEDIIRNATLKAILDGVQPAAFAERGMSRTAAGDELA